MEESARSGVKTLVICVDRDNDIGEKAGLKTPIIGREAVFSAATKLASVDPEESDINAIFEAVRIYEQLCSCSTEEGGDFGSGVILLAGDKNIGVESDRKIGQELDDALSRFRADSAVLVSDGAEDEWIIPIIQSRVKIDSLRRVVVKQSEPLESTFYAMKRMLEEPRFARLILPPIGFILLLLAISLLLKLSGEAIGLILGFIGIYILLKGLGRERLLINLFDGVKQSLYSGRISFVTYIIAIVLLLAGTSQGIRGYTELKSEINEQILLGIAYYMKFAIGWYIGAALAPQIGKMMNMLIEKKKIVRQWAMLFSITASGVILWGGSECIIWMSKGNHPMGYLTLSFSILGSVILSFIGVKISRYLRRAMTMIQENGKVEAGIETEEGIVSD